MNRHIELLAQAPDPLVRSMVANRVSKPKTINRLISDSNEDVRLALVYNRQLHPMHRIKLSTDPSEWVRRCVADHTQSPPESLALLSQAPDKAIRQAVANNPSTPESALNVLAMSPDPVCREMVGCNPSTSLNTVNQLLDDDYQFIIQAVKDALLIRELEANPNKMNMDAEKLKQQSVAVQKFLARHPQTSPATLDALSRESSTEVQVWVAYHSQTPFTALKYLLSLNNDEVTRALSSNIKLTDSTKDHQEIYRRLEKWLKELQDLEGLSPEVRRKHQSSPYKESLCRSIAKYSRNIHFLFLCEQLGTAKILGQLAANRNVPATMLDRIFFKMGSGFNNNPSNTSKRCMYHLSMNPYSSIKALKLLAEVTASILAQGKIKNTTSDESSFGWESISGTATGLVINPSTPESTKDMLAQQLIS